MRLGEGWIGTAIIKITGQSGGSVVTFGSDRVVVRGRHAPAHVLPLEGGLNLRDPFALAGLTQRICGLGLRLHLSLEVGLQSLEGYHHHGYVVQGLLVEGELHDVLDRLPAELVEGVEGPFVPLESVPNHLYHLSVR